MTNDDHTHVKRKRKLLSLFWALVVVGLSYAIRPMGLWNAVILAVMNYVICYYLISGYIIEE